MTMKRFIVESVQFNWIDGDFECPVEFQPGIIAAVLSTVWFGESEEEVISQVRESAAFDVSSIDLTYLPYKVKST
jgi:hypothetical protein|tara:strand:- start:441 stop:665 length:225 start_codon:yes stop_codon:yes gene_type:complete